MPSEVQAEIYPAIVEYALNGKEPKGLSDIAKGVFILIKPVMDANNARSEGGKKGKKFGKLGGRPAKDRAVSSAISDKPNVTPGYTLTLEQEIEKCVPIVLGTNRYVCSSTYARTSLANASTPSSTTAVASMRVNPTTISMMPNVTSVRGCARRTLHMPSRKMHKSCHLRHTSSMAASVGKMFNL